MVGDLHTLFPFQKRILNAVFGARFSQVVFSAPRGNGKTYLAARAVREVIDPEGDHFAEGRDCVLIAATLDQAGLVFDHLKDWLQDTGEYKFRESGNKLSVVHQPSGVRCRAVSSDARGAFGLGARERIIVADEPGAWQPRKGALMRDAMRMIPRHLIASDGGLTDEQSRSLGRALLRGLKDGVPAILGLKSKLRELPA